MARNIVCNERCRTNSKKVNDDFCISCYDKYKNIEAIRKKETYYNKHYKERNDKLLYKHDCERCVFLGNFYSDYSNINGEMKEYDLYHCNGKSFIGRCSDEPNDYCASPIEIIFHRERYPNQVNPNNPIYEAYMRYLENQDKK